MESLGACIDSDVLIDHLRNNSQAIERIKKLEKDGYALFTTTINSFELYHGALKTEKKEKNVEAVEELLERLILLPLDRRSSKVAAEVLEKLDAEGNKIEFRDALMAGIVISNELPITTGNVKHFNRIEGLRLV
ncbi:MAG: type II toxin-antitoxin system VapC family toxin [Candidatus Hydrothermarchaeales archaeon]